ENVAGVALFMRDRIRGDADAELNLLERLLVAQHDARDDLRYRRVESVLRGFQVLKVLDYQADELVVVEVPGGGYDDVAGGEAVGVGFENRFTLEFLYGFFGAQDGLA